MNEKELEKIFKAFANRRRLLIVKFLKKHKEASVGEVAREIKLSFKSTSRHLSVLAGAGILDREQKSIHMYYSITPTIPEVARRILTLL
ncbi:MAG: metalloregulator ArsR/SmtB family transcription factor [Candidatus Paceibacterota bacterium]